MKKAKIIIGSTMLIASIILTGCNQTKEEKFKSESPFKFVKDCGNLEVDNAYFDVYEVKDKTTGTHYYFLNGFRATALTPIIENNSVKTTKENKDKDKKLDNINKQIKELEKQKEEIENK